MSLTHLLKRNQNKTKYLERLKRVRQTKVLGANANKRKTGDVTFVSDIKRFKPKKKKALWANYNECPYTK